MAFQEDFSLFFDVGEFADAAVHTPAAGGGARAGNVIFDINGLTLDEYEVETTGPTALCAAIQFPQVREGDQLAIAFSGGTLYYKLRAVTPLKDGGLVLFTLAQFGGYQVINAGTLYLGSSALLFGADYIGLDTENAAETIFFNTDALLLGADNLVLT